MLHYVLAAAVFFAALVSLAIGSFVVLLVCISRHSARSRVAWEKPPAPPLAMADAILRYAQSSLLSLARLVGCARRFLHAMFRNRPAPNGTDPIEGCPDAALRGIASSAKLAKTIRAPMAAGVHDMAVSIQQAALMDPSAREAKLAKTLESFSSSTLGKVDRMMRHWM